MDISSYKVAIETTIYLVERVIRFVVASWRFLSVLAVVAGVYFGAYYWINVRPGNVIRTYIKSVNDTDYQTAALCFKWGEIAYSTRSDAEFNQKVTDWSKNFETTRSHKLDAIEIVESSTAKWSLSQIFSDARDYDVTYSYVDEYKKSDLTITLPIVNQAQTNGLWGYIRSVDQAIGVLHSMDPNDFVRVSRRTKAIFTVGLANGKWLIQSTKPLEIAVEF